MKRQKNSKRFFRQIITTFTATIIILLLVFSSGVSYQIEKSYIESENKNNENMLLQVKYNIDYMHSIIQDMAQGYLFDDTVVSLMYLTKERDTFELVQKMWKLNTFAKYSQYIHSVVIYNNNLKKVYATSPSLYTDEFEVVKFLEEKNAVPKNQFIPMISPTTGNKVFSFWSFDMTDSEEKPDGAVIVNVKNEWILGNVKMFNSIKGQNADSIAIMDEEGNVIAGEIGNAAALSTVREGIEDKNRLAAAEKDSIYTVQKAIKGKQYLISYLPVSNNEWTIIRVQMCEAFYNSVNNLKRTIFALTILFLFGGIMLAFRISQKVYAPVDNLVRSIVMDFPLESVKEEKNELNILMNIYKDSRQKLNKLRHEAQDSRNIIASYRLQNMLLNGTELLPEEWDYIENDKNMQLSLEQPLLLCLFCMDNEKKFREDISKSDQKLYRFAAINIIRELLGEHFKNEVFDLKGSQLLAMINAKEDEEELLISALQGFQDKIKQYFGITYTITLSPVFTSKYDVYSIYNATEANSEYRFLFGREAIITQSMIREKESACVFSIKREIRKEISQTIALGNMSDIKKLLDKVYGNILSQNLNNIKTGIVELLNIIFGISDELNAVRTQPISEDRNHIRNSLLESETSEDAYVIIMDYVERIVDRQNMETNDKYLTIIQRIKDIVEDHYRDCNLCLQSIADEVGLSSTYIGKLFKRLEGMGINDYINTVRMQRAGEWLESSELNVIEIMKKVGIENESYFYKLFKKQYGVSPKKYAFLKKNT